GRGISVAFEKPFAAAPVRRREGKDEVVRRQAIGAGRAQLLVRAARAFLFRPRVRSAGEYSEKAEGLVRVRRYERAAEPVGNARPQRRTISRHATLGEVLDPVSVRPPGVDDRITRRSLAQLAEAVRPRVVQVRADR